MKDYATPMGKLNLVYGDVSSELMTPCHTFAMQGIEDDMIKCPSC